jgi:4'-phosphopantetheinyl transferase
MTTLAGWPVVPQRHGPLTLPTDRVDCWAVSLSLASADIESALRPLLSADELARAERFRFDYLRERYIARHAAVRILLARYLATTPAELIIVPESHGRPVLAEPAGRAYFNLSHSKDVALVGVTCIAPVGVDVEGVRELSDFAEIARRFFEATEIEHLFGLPPEQRQFAFFTTWSRKEAFVKALGLGLSFPLDAFSTGRQDRPPELVLRGKPCPDWTIMDLASSGPYAAAATLASPNVPIRCQRAEWSWLMDR